MIPLMLSEVVTAMGGRTLGEAPAGNVRGVSTDTRSVGAGELFFALGGPRFDGHAFVPEALARGATAAVIAGDRVDAVRSALNGTPALAEKLVLVSDVKAALARLASFHRRQLSCEVIAVVGSNGKTTTKFMIDHVLGARLRGRCSPKSFNNEIGVPLTLLSADALDEYLVVEIGTNSPGEINQLGDIVQPDLAVITCLGEEHLEKLGSLEGVAVEECSILGCIRNGGFAAVNRDAPEIEPHLADLSVKLATFGRDARADVRVSDVSYDSPWLRFVVNGRFKFELQSPGAHNAMNAAGACAIARRLGFTYEEIAERLKSFALPPMRTEMVQLDGVTVMNDAYNSNPHSAVAAVEALELLPARGRRIVVFGEMRELGPRGPELHRKVAERLRGGRVDHVLLVGPAADHMHDVFADRGLFGPAVERCESVERCADRLSQIVREGDVVLLKASRAVGLDQVVEPLRRKCAARA
ncbi:MAG: UDP-N-acetylmuramoyl-tripeptide--D-alanyl-D-alanine ligase [Phycisphaerae bacterium]